eukprot:TRINITY_DN15246_c0_g1_i12.p2 TRINITY_DN15246_c0_g1~~TRINITY_DN15246_c0_g1_i12.p2  ORF type:complete len:255 (+),score=21.88 TRINITY_DN15246_c0_g1_i12:1670-2434(+)
MKGNLLSFCKVNCVLMRTFSKDGEQINQIVTPTAVKAKVLFAAHDGLLAGHFGIAKTLNRVQNRFWWPGISRDVKEYCRTCEMCQKCSAKGRTPDIPLHEMPRIDVPFKRIAIDIVGPFQPLSEDKHRYLLTIVDVATRFPEAIPLKTIDSVSVAEALFSVFCRLGFPEEILSDNGSQFTSSMFKQFTEMFKINCTFIPIPPAIKRSGRTVSWNAQADVAENDREVSKAVASTAATTFIRHPGTSKCIDGIFPV